MSSNQPVEQERQWRLHPASLFFELTSHMKSLVAAGVAVVTAVQGSYFYFFLACAALLWSIVESTVHYFTFRYRIADRELVVSKGLFLKRIRKVPTNKIQNIDLVQNPLHRLFRVAEVRVETASGSEPEATLKVISLKQVDSLREQIFDGERVATAEPFDGMHDENGQALVGEMPRADEGELLAHIPTSRLLKAGLASNRGMLIVGVGIGIVYQFGETFGVDLEMLWDRLPNVPQTAIDMLFTAAAIVIGLLAIRLLGMIWFLLRFHGYQLRKFGNDFRISCGLLTRVSATVPRHRIQLVCVQRPLLLRWMGLAEIQIETAGGSANEGADASKSVSGRWFLPVIPESEVDAIVRELRPGLELSQLPGPWNRLSPRAHRRLRRLMIAICVVAALIGAWINPTWGYIPGLCAIPYLVWWSMRRCRAVAYLRYDDIVAIKSGVFNWKTSVTFFDKVQALQLRQSPFDRRWGMATLSVDTAASGPAVLRFFVFYLDEEFARQEYHSLVSDVARRRPVFG